MKIALNCIVLLSNIIFAMMFLYGTFVAVGFVNILMCAAISRTCFEACIHRGEIIMELI